MQYVAFLRGMNLGNRRIKNPELCACFTQIGFTAVQAFLASGNVVFESPDDAATVMRRLEAGLAEQLGYAVPSVIRTAAEVNAIAAQTAFAEKVDAQRGKPQVIFIKQAPTPEEAHQIEALSTNADWLEVDGAVIHWWPEGGLSDNSFNMKALEAITGTTTVRTRNTVNRLAKKFL